jgi:hypothetical protein
VPFPVTGTDPDVFELRGKFPADKTLVKGRNLDVLIEEILKTLK